MMKYKHIAGAIIAFFVVSASTFMLVSDNDKKVNAAAIDDSFLGKKVVDVSIGVNDTGRAAITDDGYVYTWGKNANYVLGIPDLDLNFNLKNPKKVICKSGDCGDSKYLNNIKKVRYGYNNVYALSNDGKMYAWGDNKKNECGIPGQAYYREATLIPLPEGVKIKDFSVYQFSAVLLSTEGEIFVMGTDAYSHGFFGTGVVKDTFSQPTKIETDGYGNPIANVEKVVHYEAWTLLLLKDGTLLSSGGNDGTANSNTKFRNVAYPDGTKVTDCKDIYFILGNGYVGLNNKNQIIYAGQIDLSTLKPEWGNSVSTKVIDSLKITNNDKDFIDYIDPHIVGHSLSLIDNGRAYYANQTEIYYNEDPFNIKINRYTQGDITEEFDQTAKYVRNFMGNTNLLISKNGALYENGVKVGFGDVLVTAKKKDNTSYISEEKYNNDVAINANIDNSSYNTKVMYNVQGDANLQKQDYPTTGDFIISAKENERIYRTYEFYQDTLEDETKVIFTVDIFKGTPKLNGLKNNEKYAPGKNFILPTDWNPYIATLQKGDEEGKEYVSGTPITEEAEYKLNLKDTYGNERDYYFTITSAEAAQSINLTEAGTLIYGDTSTSANNQIGTLSLKYAENAVKVGTLKTAVLGTGGDEDKFAIDSSDNTKLKVKENLNAGTYTLHISGVDSNDLPYDGTVEIIIDPVDQNSGANKFDFDTSFSGEIFYGDRIELNSIITGGAATLTPKFTISEDTGTGAVVNNGKITPTNIGTFKLEVTKEDPIGNYTKATRSKIVKVKPKPITISVKTPLTKKAGAVLPAVDNNYEVTPALINGDTLTGTSEYEYVGSSDNNSKDNVKVKIKGLSNSKYMITFSESDVTVEQDAAGTENTDYEITGTKGENEWYISDVTFKLLQPAIDSGYNLISNTNNFTANNFIISDEGSNSVTFRMKNGTTGALTATETKTIKIDKTNPVIDKIDYAEKDGNNKSPVTGKPFDYYFVHGTDIKIEASDITSGIASYEMIATPLQDDGTVDSTKSKITDKKDSTNNTYKFTIAQHGNYEIEVKAYDAAGNSVNSTKVKVKINEDVGELTTKAVINTDASKPYDGSKWTNQKINVTLNCTNSSGVSDYYWSNDGGATYTKMDDNTLEITNTSSIKDVEYTFKAMTHDGNELTATLPIKIDVKKPVVTGIQYTQKTRNALQSFLNTVSFDHYFKEEQTAAFQGKDEESGIETFEYSITKIDKNQNPIGSADKGTGSTYNLEMDKNYKVELYALDKAGNKSDVIYSETVSIDSNLGDLELEAYVNDDINRPYDGTIWVHEPIAVHLNIKGDIEIDEYSYSTNGTTFTACPSNICTIPATSNINKEYTFRTKDADGTVSSEKMNIKIDIETPLLDIKGKEGSKDYSEGSEASGDITLTINGVNENISGVTYFYTKKESVSNTAPSTENGWKEYKNPIVIDTNGNTTYYFAGVSGAGKASTVTSYDVNLVKKSYDDIIVKAVSQSKNYVSGDWTNDDVTFTLSGGIEDTSLIQTYQYTETSGAEPDTSAIWKNVSGTSQHVVTGNMDKTYWFRVVPVDPKGTISKGFSVKIDKNKPTDVIFKTKSVAKGVLRSITDLLTTGDWSNSALQVEMEASDTESGLKEIKYIETKNGTDSIQKTYSEPLIYKEDGIVSFKATAYDNAGNASDHESISDAYKIDLTAPLIHGAVDGKTYYYVTRYITYDDGNGSGIKDALVSFNNGTFTTLNNGHKLSDEGDYTLKVSDEAGNVHEINFKIVGLPDMGDIDGSDESRDIIDQVIDEYEEVKDELTEEEKKAIEDWIDEAEQKWEDARKKVVEDKESGASVEGLDDVTFDPDTKLIVKNDESIKDKNISNIPGIEADDEIKEGFDVKLKKGDTIINPDGSVVVRIPIRNEYKYSRMKVVMIDDKGDISLVDAEIKNGFVEFTTNNPNNKFAFVGQKENNPSPNPNPDDGKSDNNIDTDGDKLPDVNIDVNGDGKADINIDTNGDGIPEVNIDTDGDGKPDYNIDINGDGKADVNIGPVEKPWKPNLCVDYNKDGKKDWCTNTYKKPYLNIDTDKDGLPDINLDLDGDLEADINIDVDGDNIPDIDIDTTGDGKPNINIDTNGDGRANINIKKLTDWKPEKNDCNVKGFHYDTMLNITPEFNIDTNGDGKPDKNIKDTGGSESNQSTSVKGQTNVKHGLAGAGTGDTSSMQLWWLLTVISGVVMMILKRIRLKRNAFK